MMTMLRRLSFPILVLALLAVPPLRANPVADPPAAPAEPAADVALVMAIDLSASVTRGAAAFQIRGHAAAFRSPTVQAAIGAGINGAIVATLVGFGGPSEFHVLVPWRRLEGAADAEAFAAAIDEIDADMDAGATAIGSAVLAAAALFDAPEAAVERRVIDIVANGFSNSGVAPSYARDAVEALGITVNGLVILDEYDWLEGYFRDEVIAGPGAFVRAVMSPEGFVRALISKLVLEIS